LNPLINTLHMPWGVIHTHRVSVGVRVVLSLLAAAMVWLVAGKAQAAAPQCDSRGAITFAPNPTLEEPMTSMDIDGRQPDDCSDNSANDLGYQHGQRGSSIELADDLARASLSAIMAIIDADVTGHAAPAIGTDLVSRIERDRLDRPPRSCLGGSPPSPPSVGSLRFAA
jgi:hypothetical protein